MANSKLLINQWRNEPYSHHLLGHQLAFTKSDPAGEFSTAMAHAKQPLGAASETGSGVCERAAHR
jgi:hypothetical protein